MESPLDILSRVAVSRSNSKNKDFDNSGNTDCRILIWPTDMAIVRNLEPTTLHNKNSDSKDNQILDDDAEVGPIDMSITTLKAASQSTNSQMSSTLKRKLDTNSEGRSVIVHKQGETVTVQHKRPSVITSTYTDVHEDNDVVQCDIVDEHFKRALGIQSYNLVFKGEKKLKVEKLCDSRKPPEEPSEGPGEGVSVKSIKAVDKPRKEDKLKKAVSQQYNSNIHSSNHELSVDDHFAKALGKSTWMRLQNQNILDK